MRWLEQLRMRLRMLVHRGQEKRRIDAELSFHNRRKHRFRHDARRGSFRGATRVWQSWFVA
jgi:hypothetical protein